MCIKLCMRVNIWSESAVSCGIAVGLDLCRLKDVNEHVYMSYIRPARNVLGLSQTHWLQD